MKPADFVISLILLFFFALPAAGYESKKIEELEKKLSVLQGKDRLPLLRQLLVQYSKVLPEKGIDYGKEGIELARVQKDINSVAEFHNLMGNTYRYLGQSDKAIDHYFQALQNYEKTQNVVGKGTVLNNIGIVYINISRYDQALDYISQAMDIKKRTHDSSGLANVYNNLATVFWKKKDGVTAIEYFNKAFEISKLINDLIGVANSYNNLGIVNMEYRNYYVALEYFSRALQISKDLKDNYTEASTLNNMGTVFIELKDFLQAGDNLNLALRMAKEINAKVVIADSYFYLSKLYKLTGQLDKALEYNTLYHDTKESIFNEEKNQKINKLREEYRMKKKDVAIEKVQTEKSFALYILVSLAVIAALLLLVVILILNKYRQNKKTSVLLDIKNSQLHELNATKDKIFRIIAHDLKNPLGAFRNLTSVMVDYYNDMSEAEIISSLRQIKNTSTHLLFLLDNILIWSRYEKGEISFEPEKIIVNYIVENLVGQFQNQVNEKLQTLAFHREEEVFAYADPGLCSFILKNILSNSVKFTPRHGRIDIYVKQDDKTTEITVSDSGMGIAEEDKHKLFDIDSNFRMTGTEGEKGTGIGLVLCKYFVEMNKGSIDISSRPGEGTTVRITLPAKENA